MAANVQRKLEFPIKKPTRQSSRKTTRRSTRQQDKMKNDPVTDDKNMFSSPRKRCSSGDSDNDEENQVPILTPSPSKKRREVPRPEDTPTRGSLAAKLAVATLDGGVSPKKEPSRLPLSPIKNSANIIGASSRSPLKVQSPLKLKDQQNRPRTPVKSTQTCNSPQKKSPSMRLARQDCEAYHTAKQSFHTAQPERLIGREKEMAEVRGFLKTHVAKKSGGSLYISGAPGTGKTAVLTHIINDLRNVHNLKRVYLNCMTLENSSHVYGKLYTDFTGKKAPTAKERLRAIEKVLTSDGHPIILVLDEIDQLDSKNQEILYTIFEWPSLKNSRLVLVGIANALDLTDRVLPRLQARPNCRPQLLNFAPYTKDQISAILKDRVKTLEQEGIAVMDPTAIQFCARKISAVAGDMRKALDVCRRAVELVETDVKSQKVLQPSECKSPSKKSASPKVPKKISVLHINNVLSDVYGSGATASQQETIPLQQKLVVCSLLLMLKQGKLKEVTAGKLHEVYCKICKNRQIAAVDQSEFQGIVTLLESRGMIGIKKAKETRMNKVTLKLDERELEHTMQDKVLVSTILQEGLPK